jgi:hypothetical protein
MRDVLVERPHCRRTAASAPLAVGVGLAYQAAMRTGMQPRIEARPGNGCRARDDGPIVSPLPSASGREGASEAWKLEEARRAWRPHHAPRHASVVRPETLAAEAEDAQRARRAAHAGRDQRADEEHARCTRRAGDDDRRMVRSPRRSGQDSRTRASIALPGGSPVYHARRFLTQ